MKSEFITHLGENKSLILLFAGWGMDATPFHKIKTRCDMAVIWDYEDFDIDITPFTSYKNIYLFAWSFGIFAASKFIQSHSRLPIIFKMAINGTQFPIDDNRGIPLNIFNATLENLSERSLMKFYHRICGSSTAYRDFIKHLPHRSIFSLRKELINIHDAASTFNNHITWDKVVASKNDLIFPFENQLSGWNNYCLSLEINDYGAHYPENLESIINQNIINKDLIKHRFSNSLNSGYEDNAIIQRKIAKSLYDKWVNLIGIKHDASILEIGCGTGLLTRLYTHTSYPSRLVLNDLCNIPTVFLNLNVTEYEFIEKDAEQLTFPCNSFDYIVSASAIQWFENLPGFFNNIHHWLKPGGAIIMSSFGPDNMKEIKEHLKISLNYKSAYWFNNEIKRNFDIVLVSEEHETMLFDSPLQVLRHIQSTGVNSINSGKIPQRAIKQLLNNYEATDGKYPLTYNPIYILAKLK